MKTLKIIFFLSLWSASAYTAEIAVTPSLPPLSKYPKSLFLIKKAKIDNDVGEPVLYPTQKQSKLLSDEKIFNKYRLQILDTKSR